MGFEWLTGRREDTVQCDLCPRVCILAPNERGDCRVRANLGGTLRALTYGLPAAVHIDPIEKKPLNHFHPGQQILSVATTGCNLHCKNCQNWTLSQTDPEQADNVSLPPEALARLSTSRQIPMVAFTYAEPLVFYEYTLDGCVAARAAGLETVLVSAGFANPVPFRRLCRELSAANIDLKSFSDDFYREVCGGSLRPVLDSLVIAREENVWLEVTFLVIPTLNDDDPQMQAMARWMVANLGGHTPLHLSRFAPQYQLENLPPTPETTLNRLAHIARDTGLEHVYVGNVLNPQGQSTQCPGCGLTVVERRGYVIGKNLLGPTAGHCPRCQRAIPGVWT